MYVWYAHFLNVCMPMHTYKHACRGPSSCWESYCSSLVAAAGALAHMASLVLLASWLCVCLLRLEVEVGRRTQLALRRVSVVFMVGQEVFNLQRRLPWAWTSDLLSLHPQPWDICLCHKPHPGPAHPWQALCQLTCLPCPSFKSFTLNPILNKIKFIQRNDLSEPNWKNICHI